MATQEVRVPDLGDFKNIPVIEVLVKVGDQLAADAPIITLESDKATMEVPTPLAGVVKEIKVKPGDKVSLGTLVLVLETAGGAVAAAPAPAASAPAAPAPATAAAPAAPAAPAAAARAALATGTQEVRVPDIGDYKNVPVVEVLVKPGDTIAKDASVVTLESDKATMEVPASHGGVVKEVKVKVGDRLSQGSLIMVLEVAGGALPGASAKAAAPPAPAPAPAPAPVLPSAAPAAPSAAEAIDSEAFRNAHAGPGVRALARALGVDLGKLKGTGLKGRILETDVHAFVKAALAAPAAVPSGASLGGLDLAAWPKVDFAKFGPIETRPLARIRKIAGKALHRNWVQIPHVTNHEDADVTDLEAFRVKINAEAEKGGGAGSKGEKPLKVTMLAFLIKAVVATLQKYPDFNSSLDGEQQVLKQYWHIGFAADTPAGLLVPVIKDADKKGILQLARETGELAAKAREGKLSPAEMSGATFSISSLGGIGGTYFTPIINAPEVAILGVCRATMRPTWDGAQFAPRLILPLSLSWDHRVVDGAGAARFNAHLATLLADARRLVL